MQKLLCENCGENSCFVTICSDDSDTVKYGKKRYCQFYECKNCEERTALITFMRQLSPPALISNRNITLLYLAIDGMAPIDGPLEFDFPLIANTMVRFIFVSVRVRVCNGAATNRFLLEKKDQDIFCGSEKVGKVVEVECKFIQQ
ncbi:hypothetical protein ACB092_01G378000 [Castanea dentata]